MHLLKTNFDGNPNIGLYGIATDTYCIIGAGMDKKLLSQVKEVLDVPIIEMNMCGTSLVGVFCVANSTKLLVPDICFEEELKILDEHKINYEVISTKHTALGNNILCNDEGCIVSNEFSDEDMEKIGKALGIKAIKGSVNGLDVVGSSAVINGENCLVHEDATEKDIELIEKTFSVKCTQGTINMGNPFIKCGIIVNKNGFLVGRSSGGPEIANADEALGFLG